MKLKTAFSATDISAFEPAEKIGIVASVSPEGLPHVSLITSIRAIAAQQLTLGEFCKGQSKANIQQNPNIGFLVMTMDRRMWRGKARWTHLQNSGPEYEHYNNMPMFRYNAYFGINTVHYLDLVSTTDAESLPMAQIVISALMTRLAKGAVAPKAVDRILKPFAENIFNRLDALKFIAYIGKDGMPEIVPVFQCQAAGSARLAFYPGAYGGDISQIPDNTTVAVFGLTMAMEDVLVRGRYHKSKRSRLIRLGTVDIEWVYNSMPPCHGQIYPPVELRPVEVF